MLKYDNLTIEQRNIIEALGNCVVIACPGSGKSTTISFKIAKALNNLKDYQGVIAISYTNKASDELKEKVYSISHNTKDSFFGTIDKFCLSEIIIPGTIKNNIRPVILSDDMIEIEGKRKQDISNMTIDELLMEQEKQICSGKIFLKSFAAFAYKILCKKKVILDYLKCKYKAIFIDEYQDCDEYQDNIFKYLVLNGLVGVAVGDPNQSIFEYAKKSSKYLVGLAADNSFKSFYLDKNHRCHQSIVDYSMKFLSPTYCVNPQTDVRVGRHLVTGSEVEVANYIDSIKDRIIKKYSIEKLSDIAILTRSNRTGEIINQNLKTKSIFFYDTKLEKLAKTSMDALACIDVIKYCFKDDSGMVADDIVRAYCPIDMSNKNVRSLTFSLQKLKKEKKDFTEVISEILNRQLNPAVERELNNTLSSEEALNNLLTINNGKISIMSIHKAKGLEFRFVIILDLHEYIIPSKNLAGYINYNEDVNLHYVSLTRAKDFVLLISSTKRTNKDYKIINANVSEFISERPDLRKYRKGDI